MWHAPRDGVYDARAACIFISSQDRCWPAAPRWSCCEHRRDFPRLCAVVSRSRADVDRGAASHLVKREYLEPDWDESREEVVARERSTFLVSL